jgi:hypothetical protein
MTYKEDLAGRFDSDAHRVVLAHLSTPTDPYGYTASALHNRIGPVFPGADEEVQVILDELVGAGHAENIGGSYRMTAQGLETLGMGLVNEPPPGAEVAGPAMIRVGLPTPIAAPADTPTDPAAPTEI